MKGGPCSIADCSRPARSKTGTYCETHYYRLRRTGTTDPRVPRERKPRILTGHPKGPANPNWAEVPTYSGLHQRLRRLRGRASDRRCHCGAPARHWAVDKRRDDLLPSLMGPYCLDLDAYTAMCVPCHKVMDLVLNVVLLHPHMYAQPWRRPA